MPIDLDESTILVYSCQLAVVVVVITREKERQESLPQLWEILMIRGCERS
jgi:hypothetical protein